MQSRDFIIDWVALGLAYVSFVSALDNSRYLHLTA
jgi:hypothetical protein